MTTQAADTKCHICGTPITCNSKDGCRESPTHHSHYQVTWGNPKSYGGWADITVCGHHTSHEISDWLQKKVDTPDLVSYQEMANQREAAEIMTEFRQDAERIREILNDKNFQKWFRKLRKPQSNSDNKTKGEKQ